MKQRKQLWKSGKKQSQLQLENGNKWKQNLNHKMGKKMASLELGNLEKRVRQKSRSRRKQQEKPEAQEK